MHLESKFTMSLVFVSTFFFLFLFFFWGEGVLRHLVVQTDFEFKISGPLPLEQFLMDAKLFDRST